MPAAAAAAAAERPAVLEPIHNVNGAWTVEDLLTPAECEAMIAKAQAAGIEQTFASRTGASDHLRDCLRVEVEDLELAVAVWKRLEKSVPQEVCIGSASAGAEPGHGIPQVDELAGRWRPSSVNARWRVVCYPCKGHFGPHRDGDLVLNRHERSFLTINGYLAPVAEGFGGATRFLTDDQPLHKDDRGRLAPVPGSVLHAVQPDAAGKSVIFWHNLMHDGEPLADGCPTPKWLFRSEVMFTRDPATAPEWTTEQAAARKLLAEAEYLEQEDPMAAAAKYRRAFKLDSELEAATFR